MRLRLVDDEQLALALSVQSRHALPARPAARRRHRRGSHRAKLPINFCAPAPRSCRCGRDGWNGRVIVAIADPHAVEVVDAVAVLVGEPVEPVVAASGRIIDHINKTYSRPAAARRLRARREAPRMRATKKRSTEFSRPKSLFDMLDANDEAPIINWVNGSLMFQAAPRRRLDIHIRPRRDATSSFATASTACCARPSAHPKKFQQSIIARVKIMAGPQHRREAAAARRPHPPQVMVGKDVDMRVATAPTASGESVTIRLPRSQLRCSSASPTSALPPITLELIRAIIKRPHGTPASGHRSDGLPARRRRSTRASPRSTRPTSTSSRSRIRSSTSSRAS